MRICYEHLCVCVCLCTTPFHPSAVCKSHRAAKMFVCASVSVRVTITSRFSLQIPPNGGVCFWGVADDGALASFVSFVFLEIAKTSAPELMMLRLRMPRRSGVGNHYMYM